MKKQAQCVLDEPLRIDYILLLLFLGGNTQE